MEFQIHAPYQPAGDQPEAINALVAGVNEGRRHQTLLGVTGSGKTFTMASIIAKVQKPTLILAHQRRTSLRVTPLLKKMLLLTMRLRKCVIRLLQLCWSGVMLSW
jgi:excinuclease UvrABC helicase subunit UvrB